VPLALLVLVARLKGRHGVVVDVKPVQEGVYAVEHLGRLGLGEEAREDEVAEENQRGSG